MADVFVSYKREDRERAEGIARGLEAAGFSVWWDDRIRPEGEWDAQIEREIAAAKAVVVLWTPMSAASRWVRTEAHNAQDRNILLPVLLEPCEIPIAFALTQTVDLTGWRGEADDRQWKKLLVWTEDLTKAPAPAATASTAPAQPRRGTYGQTAAGEDILDGATISARTPAGACFSDGPDLPAMRILPAGDFLMGASRSEPRAQHSEGPSHIVSFARTFALGIFPVTFAQFDRIAERAGMAVRPDDAGWGRADRPAINLSWLEATEFAEKLSSLTSERYRLPTESEWEYACRAGARGPFGFHDPISPQLATFDASHDFDGGASGQPAASTIPVGSHPANGFGLYDMHGNVREWVQDLWHDDYYGAPDDGLAWSGGHSAMHVVRGGGWLDPPWMLRSSARGRGAKADRANFIGFRLAREIA